MKEININIPNIEIARVIGITEGSVRKAKKNFLNNKSKRYLDYLEAYEKGINIKEYDALKIKEEVKKIKDLYKEKKGNNNANIIAVANFKGGVGKSTISMLLNEYLPNSIIVNLDYQEAEKINPEGTTCDFMLLKAEEESLTLDEYIDVITSKVSDDDEDVYDNIIIDTQGNEFNEEFNQILEKITHFIIPTTTGKRSFEKTKMTIETLLDFGINPDAKFCLIVNNYVTDKELEDELQNIEKEIRPILKDKLVCVTSLKNSRIVKKMEDKSLSLSDLTIREKQQVKTFKKRVETLNKEIAEKLFDKK